MMSLSPHKRSKCSHSSWNPQGANGIKTPSSSSSNGDLISQLPDEVLCSILMRLTLRDAVRTCVLSRRWRKVWSSLPAFKLDWKNLFHEEGYNHERPCLGSDRKFTFITKVNRFLSSCDYQSGGSLKLRICLNQECSVIFDYWIDIALADMAVHTLTLKSFCKACSSQRRKRSHIDRPVLQGNHFQDTRAVNLKMLDLNGFILGPNFLASSYLRYLQSLYLQYVDITNRRYALSAMPSLTVLKLYYCQLPVELDLGSLSNLRRFQLRYCPDVNKIIMPKNKYLRLFICVSSQIISCDLRSHPNITYLHRFVDEKELQYMFRYLPADHPELRSLLIATKVDWVTRIPENIATFYTVKLLNLWFCKTTKFDILKIISILKAFPKLITLTLWTHGVGEGDLECQVRLPKHLQHVKIGGYMNPVQIRFAIFLLKHARSLRSLVLENAELGSGFGKRRKHWDEEERQKVCDSLSGLSNARVELR